MFTFLWVNFQIIHRFSMIKTRKLVWNRSFLWRHTSLPVVHGAYCGAAVGGKIELRYHFDPVPFGRPQYVLVVPHRVKAAARRVSGRSGAELRIETFALFYWVVASEKMSKFVDWLRIWFWTTKVFRSYKTIYCEKNVY